MKVLVTGVSGQLGHDCVNELIRRGHEAIGSDVQAAYGGVEDGSEVTRAPYVRMDITDQRMVRETILQLRPDAVVHCAAWTAVDEEEDRGNRVKVNAVNQLGTG